MQIGYVNVFVSDLSRALGFYRDTLGLSVNTADEQFGYASLTAGPISFGLAQTDDPVLLGRHTGIGFITGDIDSTYQELLAKGVEFDTPPTAQPWGGVLALFKDLDGNLFYLDPGHSDT